MMRRLENRIYSHRLHDWAVACAVDGSGSSFNSKDWNKKGFATTFIAANPYVLAERTGLEPATPGVTGRYSNQLNYHSW